MARVNIASAAAARARQRAGSKAASKRARPHRVIFESVSQEKKKKLRTVISFQAEAPDGYTFIPAGNPRLTQRCKEYSRARGQKIFVVSTSHKKANDITQHVHRIGYHFISPVVSKACQELRLYISRNGRVREMRDEDPYSISGAYPEGYSVERDGTPSSTSQPVSQDQLNADAREALTDLFPKIPEKDKRKIISRAFKKGKNKVGTALGVSLPRRVQLAVLAHIRHVYTKYDKVIKHGNFHEARKQVAQSCADKLLEWRGDDEDGKFSASNEEILREVIVISDDEDDEDGGDQGGYDIEDDDSSSDESIGRNSSVEMIDSQPIVQELRERPPGNHHGPETLEDAIGDDQPYITDPSLEGGRKYAAQPLRYSPQREQQRINRRGFHRYKAVYEDDGQDVRSGPPATARPHNRQLLSNRDVPHFVGLESTRQLPSGHSEREMLVPMLINRHLSLAKIGALASLKDDNLPLLGAGKAIMSHLLFRNQVPDYHIAPRNPLPPADERSGRTAADPKDPASLGFVRLPRAGEYQRTGHPADYHMLPLKRQSYPMMSSPRPQDVAMPSIERSGLPAGPNPKPHTGEGPDSVAWRLRKSYPAPPMEQGEPENVNIRTTPAPYRRTSGNFVEDPMVKRRRTDLVTYEHQYPEDQDGQLRRDERVAPQHVMPMATSQQLPRSPPKGLRLQSVAMSSKGAIPHLMPMDAPQSSGQYSLSSRQGGHRELPVHRELPRTVFSPSHDASLLREPYFPDSQLSRKLENHRVSVHDTHLHSPLSPSRPTASGDYVTSRSGNAGFYGPERGFLVRRPQGDVRPSLPVDFRDSQIGSTGANPRTFFDRDPVNQGLSPTTRYYEEPLDRSQIVYRGSDERLIRPEHRRVMVHEAPPGRPIDYQAGLNPVERYHTTRVLQEAPVRYDDLERSKPEAFM
ncbi:MAG: hypothetical protein M4579_005146 [Chaenotheca gracillima]|nr:MAG: hypothetical protein M4579_005146 [Chaenotheca gracillima]